jgi:alkylation response protein AidB-like acyl-CoA dehydrogenase
MTSHPWPEGDASLLAPLAEQDDLRALARDIVEGHASHEQVRRAGESELGYSAELWALLNTKLNVGTLALPEEQGGLGFGVSMLSVVLEEAGRALLPEPLLVSAVLGARAVGGASDVPAELSTGVLDGSLLASVALGDHADSNLSVVAAGGRTTVSGRISRVLYGTSADLVVTTAESGDGEGLYLVDLSRSEAVQRTELEVLDLTRRQATLELTGAPAHLLAGPEQYPGLVAQLAVLQAVGVAAEQVGMIDALLDMTRTYTLQRHQFGRPLASFQIVKHRLADMLVDLERARSATRYAAAILDEDPDAAALPAAIAGAVCADAVVRVALEAVQLHGGVGFTWEHPAHYYVRRALADEATFGSGTLHRARVADLVGI